MALHVHGIDNYMCIGSYVETDLVDFVDFIHRLSRQTKVGHLTHLVLGHQDVTSSQILHKLNSAKGYKEKDDLEIYTRKRT